MPLLNTNYMAFNKSIKWWVLVSLHFYLLLIVTDLFSRYVLFSHFRPRDGTPSQYIHMHMYA